MQSSSTRPWNLPSQGVGKRRRESITEPSGGGAFAEAMRELIAQLTPVPEALHQAAQAHETSGSCSRAEGRASTSGAPAGSPTASQPAARPRHLYLVR